MNKPQIVLQAETDMVACHDCDLLHVKRKIEDGEIARCSRCGAMLYLRKRISVSKTLAFSIAALIFFILACSYPLITLKTMIGINSNTLFQGAEAYYSLGFPSLAFLVFLATMFFPLLKILILLYIFIPLSLDKTPPYLGPVFRVYQKINCWGMLEVYLFTIFIMISNIPDELKGGIAIVKTFNTGFWMFFLLLLTSLSASLALDPHVIWQKLEDNL